MESKAAIMLKMKDDQFPMGIVPTVGTVELSNKINEYLIKWYYEANPEVADEPDAKKTLLVSAKCPRFASGRKGNTFRNCQRRRSFYRYRRRKLQLRIQYVRQKRSDEPGRPLPGSEKNYFRRWGKSLPYKCNNAYSLRGQTAQTFFQRVS